MVVIGAGSTIVTSSEATPPPRTQTPHSNTPPNSRSSPARTIPSASPDMSHVSVIVVGGLGENDSIHVMDSSLAATNTSSTHNQLGLTNSKDIERSCSSASHSSNASSLGTGMSISSSNNSAAFNIKGRQESLQEEDEPSYDPNLIQMDKEAGNRGPSQNSVRLEGTTLDATEDDMMEEPYTNHNGHIHKKDKQLKDIQRTGQLDSEEDSGVIEDTRLGKSVDDIPSELPQDSPVKSKHQTVSARQFYNHRAILCTFFLFYKTADISKRSVILI